MEEKEIWVSVNLKPFQDKYEVSNLGVVRQKRSKYILKSNIDGRGYSVILLYLPNIKRLCKIHRLLMLSFRNVSNSEELYVNHIDGNKLNNHLDNLEWCTAQENIRHAFEIGLFKSRLGSNNGNSKFTSIELSEFVDLYNQGLSTYDIGDLYGVSGNCILQVLKGSTYKGEVDLSNLRSINGKYEDKYPLIIEMLIQGMPQREIAKLVGCSSFVVQVQSKKLKNKEIK